MALDPKTGLYKSDLGFELKTRRTGRKISHLKFIIKKQKVAPMKQLKIEASKEVENPHKDTAEYKAMLELAISEKHALAFIKQYGAEYIAEKLQVLAECQKTEIVKNPAGLLISALKEDRKSERLIQLKKEQEKREREEREKAIKKAKADLSFEFYEKLIANYLENFTEEQKKQKLESIKKECPYVANQITSLYSGAGAGFLLKEIPVNQEDHDRFIKSGLQKMGLLR